MLYVGSQIIDGASDLFYAPVTVGGTYDLVEFYGFKFIIPILLVPRQKDEFIIDSNVIKCVLQKMKAKKKVLVAHFLSKQQPEV